MYIISLKGENVFRGQTTLGVVNSLDSLPALRKRIEEEYNVKFGNTWYKKIDDCQIYANIADDRDIDLIIDKIPVLD